MDDLFGRTATMTGLGESRAIGEAERRDRLRLFRSENVGPVTWHRLLAAYGSAADALAALPELSRRGGRRKPVKVCPKGDADREMAALERLGARLLTAGEPDYPAPLAALEDAPPVLAVRGHPHLLARPAVALVGARNASAAGRRLARGLAGDLAGGGLLVVSGMARGIDGAVHEGALDGGTAAVLAGGPDVVYPPDNENLYHRMVEGGAVLSEMPPGAEPQARHFPRRNRIIAGLALGTVVVEATGRSGSLITARLAAENGREVMGVPGSPADPRSHGPNNLIRQGATLVENADDVRRALAPLLDKPLGEAPDDTLPAPRPDLPEDALAAARDAIRDALGPAPVHVDELLRLCDVPAPLGATVLLELELAGVVARHPGNQVALA